MCGLWKLILFLKFFLETFVPDEKEEDSSGEEEEQAEMDVSDTEEESSPIAKKVQLVSIILKVLFCYFQYFFNKL